MGLLATTCLGALRGEATPPDNKDVVTPPLDPAAFPSCTGHAECKPAAVNPNDPEGNIVGPTFCAEVSGISGGRCHPCSECHQDQDAVDKKCPPACAAVQKSGGGLPKADSAAEDEAPTSLRFARVLGQVGLGSHSSSHTDGCCR